MSKLIKKLLKPKYLLMAIFAIGFFLRIYRAEELMGFGQDSDVTGWIMKDILINKHPRLVGQETSMQGVYIGPVYYYLMAPFYLIYNMDPFAGAVFAAILGIVNIWSFYFVFSKMFDKSAGLVAAFIYGLSYLTVMNDRSIVVISLIFVWSAWFLYSCFLIINKKQTSGLILASILIGLAWNISVTLVLLAPMALVSFYLSKKTPKLRTVFYTATAFLLSASPFLLFELRNNFPQTKSLFLGMTNSDSTTSYLGKLIHVLRLASENINTLFLPKVDIATYFLPILSLFGFYFLLKKKIITNKLLILLVSWQLPFLVFFTLFQRRVPSYYIHGMLIAWILLFVLLINYLLNKKKLKKWAIVVLIAFTMLNVNRIINFKSGGFGYRERRAVVQYIKADAQKHGFPCVAVSHMAKPGYDLGYRYLFWLEDMHVNEPSSGSPVYSIVYPTNLAGRLDAKFGSIGVVLPDYERYELEKIIERCQGENPNLTSPMFLYTE